MRKIKDFFYNCSDIFLILLIIALTGLIIVWRAQNIMGYSSYLQAQKHETVIDIDFTDVDLGRQEQEELPKPVEEDPKPSDEITDYKEWAKTFVSDKLISVSVKPGALYKDVINDIAASYYPKDTKEFEALHDELFNVGLEMKADYKLQIATFNIPAGSSIETILRIITRTL